jgi:hypothetical protein
MAVMETNKWLTIPVTFAALSVVQLFHSIEEIITGLYSWFPRVTGEIHERIKFFPRMRMSRPVFVVANVAAVSFMLVISVLLFRRIPRAVRIARLAAVVEILNGIAHVTAAIVRRKYFPGAFSAVGLIIFGVLFFRADYIERAVSRLDIL